MAEKEEKKRLEKQKEKEEEDKLVSEFAKYRIGALNQGGGSPIRNPAGDVVSQHVPFSSISQHNGGVEVPRTDSRESINVPNQIQANPYSATPANLPVVSPFVN